MDLNCSCCDLHKYRSRVVQRNEIQLNRKGYTILLINSSPSLTDESFGKFGAEQEIKFIKGLFLDVIEPITILIKSIYLIGVTRCLPRDGINYNVRDPLPIEALKCFQWIHLDISELKPTYIFFLGEISTNYCQKEYSSGHPLISAQNLMIQGGKGSPNYQKTLQMIRGILKDD